MFSDYKKVVRRLPVILTVLWMAVIFWFSSAPADESTDMSLSAGMAVGRLMVPDFGSWSAEKQQNYAEQIDYPVRKCAHAGEYALLAVFCAGSAGALGVSGEKKKLLAGWLTAGLYAASDEFHQLFVPGRSGQASDVLLDSLGAAAGILLIAIIHILWTKLRKRE